jgi:hypothetical protein
MAHLVRGVRGARVSLAMSCAIGLWASWARAQSDGQPAPDDTQVHAFVSQGFIKSSANNYLSYSQRGAFDYTEAAVNLTKDLTDDFRVGAQLFTRDLGPNGSFTPSFDWAYLAYRFRDWLGLRAGRVKIPFGLYNEGSEADQARVPVLLPQSVYPIDHQDYLLAATGGELYGNLRLGDVGDLEYRAYGGTLQVNTPASATAGITVANLNVPYVLGGRLTWSTPVDGLLIGGSFQDLNFDWDYDIVTSVSGPLEMAKLLPKGFDGTLPVKFRVTLYVASAEYQTGNLLLSSEYSRWVGAFDSAAPALLPPQTVNERYYVMASYHLTSWFTPGVYYSAYYPNVKMRSGRQNYQNDVAVTARYDINKHWLVKLEGHFMDGTADLDSTLNGGQNLSALTKDWGVFLVKTTAYF